MAELNERDILNRERFFSLSYQKDIKVVSIDGKKAAVKLDDIKEYDIMHLRNEYGVITIPSIYIDEMWLYLIWPVVDKVCYGIICGKSEAEVSSFIECPRLWQSKLNEQPIDQYGPKLINLREIIMQYKIWKET